MEQNLSPNDWNKVSKPKFDTMKKSSGLNIGVSQTVKTTAKTRKGDEGAQARYQKIGDLQYTEVINNEQQMTHTNLDPPQTKIQTTPISLMESNHMCSKLASNKREQKANSKVEEQQQMLECMSEEFLFLPKQRTKPKKLVYLSRTVYQLVEKNSNTTCGEIVKQISQIHIIQKKKMDYTNVQRRVYDTLNVLSALNFIKKENGQIISQNKFPDLTMNPRLLRLQLFKNRQDQKKRLHEQYQEYYNTCDNLKDMILQKLLKYVVLNKLINRNQQVQQQPAKYDNASRTKNFGKKNNSKTFDQNQYDLKQTNSVQGKIGIRIPFQGLYVKQFTNNQQSNQQISQIKPASSSREINTFDLHKGVFPELADIYSDQSLNDFIDNDNNHQQKLEQGPKNNKPFIQLQLSYDRQAIMIGGELNYLPEKQKNFIIMSKQKCPEDELVQFQENHVLQKLGLAQLSLEDIKSFIKPQYQELLCKYMDVTNESEIDSLTHSQSAKNSQEINQGQQNDCQAEFKQQNQHASLPKDHLINQKLQMDLNFSVQNRNSSCFDQEEQKEQLNGKRLAKASLNNYEDFDVEESQRFRKYRKLYNKKQNSEYLKNLNDFNNYRNGLFSQYKQLNQKKKLEYQQSISNTKIVKNSDSGDNQSEDSIFTIDGGSNGEDNYLKAILEHQAQKTFEVNRKNRSLVTIAIFGRSILYPQNENPIAINRIRSNQLLPQPAVSVPKAIPVEQRQTDYPKFDIIDGFIMKRTKTPHHSSLSTAVCEDLTFVGQQNTVPTCKLPRKRTLMETKTGERTLDYPCPMGKKFNHTDQIKESVKKQFQKLVFGYI